MNCRLREAGGDLDRAVFLDSGEEKKDPQLVAVRVHALVLDHPI
jgi:hypothetical protein